MSTITAGRNEVENRPVRIDGDRFYSVVADLCELADTASSKADYYGRCLVVLCEYFNAGVGSLNLRMGARTLERTFSKDDTYADSWTDTIDSFVLRTQSEDASLVQAYKNQSGVTVAHVIASPIMGNDKSFGAVAFAIGNSEIDDPEVVLVQLHQLLELIVENTPVAPPPESDGTQDQESRPLQSVVRASDYRSIDHLCFAIANSLCSKLGCEQVALGLIHNRDVRLVAVSGLSEVPKSTPGMMAVRQSMAACYDRGEMTLVQTRGRSIDQCESTPCKIHENWHGMTGGAGVATIPLKIDGECVAILSLRRGASHPFMPDDMKRARILAESFAPALPLVDRASRSVIVHATESAMNAFVRLFSWNHIGRKVVATMLIAGVAWACFGSMNYDVFAPCKIVPEQVNTSSAPYDGMIENVYVVPGQRVRTGQKLIQFDTRDLLIEKSRILSDITSHKIEAHALLQERRSEEAFLQQAKIHVLTIELQLVDERIHRAELRACVDGVILPTEIHRRVGQYVSLGEPLLEIADENLWHVEIETPEKESRHIAIEQSGLFQTNARPDKRLPCKIKKISPSSEVVGHRNVVVAEAALDNREEWMKIGMEGHIRIQTGRQPIWWVYLHPIIDYARMNLWL